MALKKITVVVSKEGRDKAKHFIITEAPPAIQEDFAMRVFFAALNAGAEIPDGVAEMGVPGLMAMGFKGLSLIPYERMKPLFAEMLSCVEYQPDPSKPIFRSLANGYDGDVEELSTLLMLRKEVFYLHASFTQAADQSTTGTSVQAAANS